MGVSDGRRRCMSMCVGRWIGLDEDEREGKARLGSRLKAIS